MKKRILALLLCVSLCLCCAAFAEEEGKAAETSFSFRAMPGYTCFPLASGDFCLDCPMEWDGCDTSDAYGVSAVIAMDPSNQAHHVMITELTIDDQLEIMNDDENPLSGFLNEGIQVIQGRSTEGSKILEQFDLHGLAATRVEMVGQGYEMIWVLDQPKSFSVGGDLWFFMYPADPEDKEYTGIVREMVDSFTVYAPYSMDVAPASDFEYEADGDGICITAYTGSAEYVRIPDEIDGKPVISMGHQAFYEKPVRHVSFPDSMRTMGRNVFGGCTHLVFTALPESLEVLPSGTFESCFRLNDPSLNDGLKKIEQNAFWGCNYLQYLFLPDSLEEIEDAAFVMCDYLDSVYAGDNSRFFKNNRDYSLLLSADGSKLIHCSYQWEGDKFQVPDGVKQIYAYAFNRVDLSGGITLPESLEYIGYAAFVHTGLTEIRIPENCKEIGIMLNVWADGADEPATAYTHICETLKKVHGVKGSPAMDYAERQNVEFVPDITPLSSRPKK